MSVRLQLHISHGHKTFRFMVAMEVVALLWQCMGNIHELVCVALARCMPCTHFPPVHRPHCHGERSRGAGTPLKSSSHEVEVTWIALCVSGQFGVCFLNVLVSVSAHTHTHTHTHTPSHFKAWALIGQTRISVIPRTTGLYSSGCLDQLFQSVIEKPCVSPCPNLGK